MLKGCVAAGITPLGAGGAELDEDAFGPYLDFLAAGGVDGVLALGTTGRDPALARRAPPRRRGFLAAAAGRLDVAVHAGAQTTADTVALAEHAASIGADAVAVIAPPYYALDAESVFRHLAAAAAACAPTPFYVYEFAARAGYAIPVEVVERLRDACPNLAGLKVSDTPWEAFAPYLLPGLQVFAGPEALIARCLAHGGVGAVSGLASAFPEVVSGHVAASTDAASGEIARLRAAVQGVPFQSALKHLIARRGVPVRPDVRAPLRPLEPAELDRLLAAVDDWHASARAALPG
ncbi:MAG: dihydrodipicolinate synthase family protein [Thermoleophilia bacterium]